MKKLLTISLFCTAAALVFPVAQSFSDEASDIEAVDRVLEAEDVALELYKRAQDRANKAVAASSLGKKAERLRDEYWAAMEALEKTRAYREYLGSDKQPAGELFFRLDLYYEESREERMARLVRYFEAQRERYNMDWDQMEEWRARRERYDEEQDARREHYAETRRSFRIEEIVEEHKAADFRMNALRVFRIPCHGVSLDVQDIV